MDATVLYMITLLVCLLEGSLGSGCRNLKFNTFIPGKALTNHTIRTVEHATSTSTCSRECYLEPFCLSFNYCRKKPDESAFCELTQSDHVRHYNDLTEKKECTYHGTQNHCSSNPCTQNATCMGDYLEEAVPYKCICPAGYEGKNCENEIDECSTGKHDCHVNATCNNTIGGFNCTCKSGYHGNGKQCEDINECTSDKHDCHVMATCINLPGDFNCTCPSGFGDGRLICCSDLTWYVIYDFENGKVGWTLTGTVFNNQPTYGDNPAARGRGQRSNHKGDYWIGGYENRPSPSDPAGGNQSDVPKGTMTSPKFLIRGPKLRFLIGAGCDIKKEWAELLIGGAVVAKATGVCKETMVTKYWDVFKYVGQFAQLRLVDNNSKGWGHLNFDHLEGQIC